MICLFNVYCYFANGEGAGYAHFWYEHIASDPINLRTHSKVTELLVSDGWVTGVRVEDQEKEYEIIYFLISGTQTPLFMLIDSKYTNQERLEEHLAAQIIEPYDSLEDLAIAHEIDPETLMLEIAAASQTVRGCPIHKQLHKQNTVPIFADGVFYCY